MERLRNEFSNSAACAICGARRNPRETWFLLTENKWQDRLDIWRWTPQMAGAASAYSLCGPWHVRELVVHWMTTGCLDYPFASGGDSPLRGTESDPVQEIGVPLEHKSAYLGEIAVDRDGLSRVLRDNSLILNTILSELIAALEKELPDVTESEAADEPSLVTPCM